MLQLPEEVKVVSKEGNRAVFEIAPLMPGYGATVANALRRVLLSSLEGAAITSIKVKGIDHEFTSIPGILEDVIELILNVKKIRFKSYHDAPVIVSLHVKGERTVAAKDIKLTSDVELITEDQHIATITDKKTELEMEFTIEKGIGYVPVEQKQKEKLPIGVIAVDAIFSPVRLVNFRIDDIRVGQRIDYNKIIMEVETDGSMQPEEAFKRACEILIEHFRIVSQVPISEPAKSPSKRKKVK